MDNAIKSPIFKQTASTETVTSLKEKIFNTKESKIYSKAKISAYKGVNIFLLSGLCLCELKES